MCQADDVHRLAWAWRNNRGLACSIQREVFILHTFSDSKRGWARALKKPAPIFPGQGRLRLKVGRPRSPRDAETFLILQAARAFEKAIQPRARTQFVAGI